ncbi:MAG: hypothetical protein CO096_00995, partial [Armatimonadetes bacterium CG_4_9_14_3_um_filter_66_14]
TALFALLPNLRETADVTWQTADGQNLVIRGPGWADSVTVTEEELTVVGNDGKLDCRLPL